MSNFTTIPDAWPGASSVITLIWALSQAQGRVTRATQDLLALALAAGHLPLPDIGASLGLRWGDIAGMHERPVSLQALRSGLVHVAPDGPASSLQRRRFYRAAVTLDATIDLGRHHLTGRTLDLSEGGSRVAVDGRSVITEAAVTTKLVLDTEAIDVPARVVRRVPAGREAHLGLEFGELPERSADQIRRRVLRAQISDRTGDDR